METVITVGLVLLLACIGWVVAKAFRAGAPTGESSARADINASSDAYGSERMDSARI